MEGLSSSFYFKTTAFYKQGIYKFVEWLNEVTEGWEVYVNQ